MTGDPTAWRSFSAHLSQALELEPDRRGLWLEELAHTAPDDAQRIRTLLDSGPAMRAAGFLEAPPSRPEPAASLVGARVGAWRIEAEIGRGGMSSVWRARRDDGRAHGVAAIKFLSFAALGREGEARFRREGMLLGRLDHPNIARLLDAGVFGETRQPYLVLEYVDGVPIDEHCERAGLGTRARVELILAALNAVSHAHGQLIVHRDLKPSNILVARDGTLKLLDFGIAKLLEDGESDPLTRTGVAALTPLYAAPEQITGAPATTRSDVYALGLVLYRLLTGRHAAELAGLPLGAARGEPPLPSSVVPGIAAVKRDLRGDLDNIVAKALRRERGALRDGGGVRGGSLALPETRDRVGAAGHAGVPALEVRAPQSRGRGRRGADRALADRGIRADHEPDAGGAPPARHRGARGRARAGAGEPDGSSADAARGRRGAAHPAPADRPQRRLRRAPVRGQARVRGRLLDPPVGALHEPRRHAARARDARQGGANRRAQRRSDAARASRVQRSRPSFSSAGRTRRADVSSGVGRRSSARRRRAQTTASTARTRRRAFNTPRARWRRPSRPHSERSACCATAAW